MKLHLSILEKLIDLPTQDATELRHILDDLGLEVKDLLTENGKPVFNIETLANRGDHLSALGVARELSARYLSGLKFPPIAALPSDRKASVPVRVTTEKCLRYALLEGTVPAGMALRNDVGQVMGGQSDKPAMVDLSNYVLLELGQPTHAFDRDKIDGEIIIETISQPATVEALDGKTYTVPADSIVIRDKKKIVAVAGVIGCANSMMTGATTRVLIESAAFDPVSVRKTARAMGLSTDASYTFERGSDIEGVIPALRRLMYLAEGSAGAVKEESGAHSLGLTLIEGRAVEKRRIPLTLAVIRQQINAPRLAESEVSARLKNLGFNVEPGEAPLSWKVTVPSWRMWDIHTQEDLVEEFARSHGLSRVRPELPPLDSESPEPSAVEMVREYLEPTLLGQGFLEVMTKSFYSSSEVSLLNRLDSKAEARHIKIRNSLERGYSHLKTTNVWHMAHLLEMNSRRGLLGAKVFEIGRIFSEEFKNEEYEFEKEVVTLAALGRWSESDWRKCENLEQRVMLFRGVLDALIRAIGQEPSVSESKHPFLHPGVQGSLKAGRMICGVYGLVHPTIKEALGSRNDILYAELDAQLFARLISSREFVMPSDFPSVKRDLTLKVERRELAERVIRYVEEAKPNDLLDVAVADDFKKPEEDFRRLTLRLTFQSRERTLESAEVDASMTSLLQRLSEKHGISLAQ